MLRSGRIAMLTNGPNARINGILEMDMPCLRESLALAADPRFAAARAAVLEFLNHRHTAPGLAAA